MSARPPVWEVAAFAACFAVAGLVLLTLAWSGPGPYRAFLGEVADPYLPQHEGWVAYVTGRSGEQPPDGILRFTAGERAHMADVRAVFVQAQLIALAAGVGLAALVGRALRRGTLARLARAGTLTAMAAVTVLAIVAVLAFDALFLLFHLVVFPQGNFLFPPGSELLVLYPDPYWHAITIALALSFIALAGAIALLGHARVRRSRADAGPPAIVTPR